MLAPSILKPSSIFRSGHLGRFRYVQMARKTPRLALLLDFDGTITKNDTTAIIGSKCLARARELAQPGLPENQLPKTMDFYGKQYIQEYQAWKDSRTGSLEDCVTVEDVVSYLSASRSVEEKSFLRVRDAVLRVSDRMREMERNQTERNDFMMESGRRAVRTGELNIRNRDILRQLIDHAEQDGNIWGIISVSWSRRFILGALIEAGLIDEAQTESVAEKIQCNELLAPMRFDQDGRPVITCTAQDKLVALNEFMCRTPPDGRKNMIVVYVGDSSTDIGCLATAAVGFHLNDNPDQENPAIQTVTKLGVESKTIYELMASHYLPSQIVEEQHAGRSLHAITEVKGFHQIWTWVSKYLTRSE